MKVLLINPYYIGWQNDVRVEPIGLLYIASWLIQNGYQVSIHDAYLGETDEDLIKKIRQFRPDMVGCSVYTVHTDWCYQIAKLTKLTDPNVTFVVGGPHPTFCSETMLEACYEIDLVIRGEGELIFEELCQWLARRKKLEDILGITYRQGDRIISNGDTDRKLDVDAMPWPSKDLLDPKYYEKYHATGIISSRGCPYKCKYCVSPVMFDGIRVRDIREVAAEVKWCIDHLQIKHVHFYDDIFALNLQRVKDIHEYIGSLGITWDCYIRVDQTTPEMLRLMKEAGCIQARFGVETGDYESRKQYKGGYAATNEKYVAVSRECKQLGIESLASFIFGFPEQIKEDILRTIDFADELDTDLVGFYKLTPYPGTAFYDMVDTSQISYDNYSKHFIDVSISRHLTSNELTKLMVYAYNKYYSKRETPDDPDALQFINNNMQHNYDEYLKDIL